MRIAIANDSVIAVEALRRIVVTTTEYELAWVAYDGAEAVSKCAVDTPDLILMDLLMPVMDGVEATRRIMAQFPCAILMVTASVNGLAAKVFEAMGYGALDAVNTPIWGKGEQAQGSAGLLKKIATIAKLIGKSPRRSRQSSMLSSRPSPTPKLSPLVVIGASTGGPQALATILSQLPMDFPAAVVIVQHVDAQFAPNLAEWLNQQTPLPVALATPGYQPEAGKVWLAGTNQHLVMRSNFTLGYTIEPQNSSYCPSVNTFFKSVAAHWGKQGIGILLTGMGRDGAEGLVALRAMGWQTIAQDQATCVVYGMPKAAVELGAASQVLPITAIAASCIRHCQQPPRPKQNLN